MGQASGPLALLNFHENQQTARERGGSQTKNSGGERE